MSYDSRNNTAFAGGGELPLEEFMKLFSSAMKAGWENMKKNPPQHQCQWHGDKYVSDDNGQCLCPAEFQTAMVTKDGNLQPILLCSYHAKKLNKQLGQA